MLGTSAENLKYRTYADFRTTADYLDYMYGGIQGVVYRATIDPKYKHSYHRTSGLDKVPFEGENNVYISMNTFYRSAGLKQQRGRSVDLLKRLNALYVDIDCYKKGLTKNEVLLRLNDEFFGSKIPEPTFIIDSGRGLYLIWKLRNEDRKALPRWTAVEQYLTDTLEELGADQACTDAARVLRVPGSRNKKSGTDVSILEFFDLTYSIYDIAQEYDIKAASSCRREKHHPYGHATEKQRKFVNDIAKRLDLPADQYPDFENFKETAAWIAENKPAAFPGRGYCYEKGSTYDLTEYQAMKGVLGSYCAEIRKLFSMRKGANCKREIGLFLYRYFLREMKYDGESALKETLAFNASLDCPFDEEYVIKATASADRRIDKKIPYAYKKSTIIKILEITKEELDQLPFLAAGVQAKEVRKESQRERNRRNYEARRAAAGKVAKKDTMMERRAAILALQEQGKTAAEIQAELKIGKTTYYRDVESLEDPTIKAQAEALLKQVAAKKTAERAAGSAKKRIFPGAVRVAHRFSESRFTLVPFFHRPIYRLYSVAVPHIPVLVLRLTQLLSWLRFSRAGPGSPGAPAGSPAL